MVYFTSDTHYNHENIIEHCKRPFQDKYEMDDILIHRFNSRVSKNDDVYHLGDFAFASQAKILSYIEKLNFRHLYFVEGNHDDNLVKLFKNRQIPNVTLLPSLHRAFINNQWISLCHYKMEVWRDKRHGAWHLYGHSHGTLPSKDLSFDVGVDCHNFYPVSFTEVKEIINNKSNESKKD